MSAPRVLLAREKELLLARSTLCRLRLRSQTAALGGAFRWRGVAFSIPALARAARFGAAAIRVVFLAKLALSLVRHVRTLGRAR